MIVSILLLLLMREYEFCVSLWARLQYVTRQSRSSVWKCKRRSSSEISFLKQFSIKKYCVQRYDQNMITMEAVVELR